MTTRSRRWPAKEAVVAFVSSPATGRFQAQRPHVGELLSQQSARAARVGPFVTLKKDGQFDVMPRSRVVASPARPARCGWRSPGRSRPRARRPVRASKKAGFPTCDARVKERKKYGLKKARKAPQQVQQAVQPLMGALFGTDGVRGLANADLTPELAMAVAGAAVRLWSPTTRRTPTAGRGRRGTRASGEMLQAVVVAGSTSAGATCRRTSAGTADPRPLRSSWRPTKRMSDRAVGLAQPDARQRAQLFARRQHRGRRRHRGRDEGRGRVPTRTTSDGAAVGRPRVADDADGSPYLAHLQQVVPSNGWTDCTLSSIARTGPPHASPRAVRRSRSARECDCGRARRPRNINEGVGPRISRGWSMRCAGRVPILGIAHDGDRSLLGGWTPPGRRSTAISCSAICGARVARGGPPAPGHGRCTGDEPTSGSITHARLRIDVAHHRRRDAMCSRRCGPRV